MPEIPFAKFHSLENDFLVVEPAAAGTTGFRWTPQRVAAICHRRRGVGADGLVVLGPMTRGATRFRLFNADGSTAEWSGNGLRCAAAFLARRPAAAGQANVQFMSAVGPIYVSAKPAHPGRQGKGRQTAVSFERPVPDVLSVRKQPRLQVRGAKGPFIVNAGNPHLVYLARTFDFPWEQAGFRCQPAARATQGVNVEFVRVISRRHVEMRIFERGVGPTPSSGSGALAAAATCLDQDLIAPRARVDSPGGSQVLDYDAGRASIRLTAATNFVFDGTWLSE